MKKIQIMENYYSIHGKASSPFEMAGEIRKRYPAKKGSYVQECISFIKSKNEQRIKNRQKENTIESMICSGMLAFEKAFKQAKLTWMI